MMSTANTEAERTIRIDGINRLFTDETFYELFSNVGLVDSVSLHFSRGANSGYALVVFHRNCDAMSVEHFLELYITYPRRASALNVITCCNTTLKITYQEKSFDVSPNMARSDTHDRKNLYVLNIPLDMTSDEFRDLFTPYGTVTHAVILAMLDTSSRRRGFVDMSTPKEAAEALNRLNGADIRTYQLEVSYALVQRSGYSIEDRTKSNRPVKHRVPVLSSRVAKEPISAPSNTKFASLPAHKSLMESNFTPDFMSRSYSQPQADFNHGFNPYVSAFAPNATSDASTYPIELANQICLVIKNLPIMIVKSDAELRMFIQSLGPVEPFRGNMFALPDSLVASAIVTFMSPSDAALVMHAINGKYIGGNLIEVNHTTNTPNRIQDMGWVPAMEGPKNVRRSVSEKKPLKIPAFGETPRFFSAPHDRYTFTAPIPQNKVTTIIGEGKTSSEDHSTTSLESLLERSELIDEHKRRQIHTSETGDSSFLDASLSTNEVSSPSNASAKNFLIHGSPSVESPIFNTRSTTEHIKDKENYPIIDRSNSRFNID